MTQCALSRICGVCGESLARPVAFLGSVEEADRNAFHFPPSHVECAETALDAVVEGLERGPGLSLPAGGVGSGDHLGVRVHPAHPGDRGRTVGVLAELGDRRAGGCHRREPAVRLAGMPAAAAEVDADGQAVRVSSPDRLIYPATESTPDVTKLQVVEYYLSVGDGIMRALRDRPTALERWTSGVHEGIKLATGRGDKSDAFYSKRVPKGAPSYVETTRVAFPSGRPADEVCVRNLATVAWCAQMGTIVFHPWPTRDGDNDHPDELRIDLDPQPGTTFTDAVRVAGVARELLEEHGITGYPKTSGNRGVHIYIRIEPRWDFVDVRHAAIGFGRALEKRDAGVTTKWWKEERGERIFVDFNQNSRDRTIASAYSLRPLPGAPVSTPVTWDELAGLTDPRVFNLFSVPGPDGRRRPVVHRSTTSPTRSSR